MMNMLLIVLLTCFIFFCNEESMLFRPGPVDGNPHDINMMLILLWVRSLNLNLKVMWYMLRYYSE